MNSVARSGVSGGGAFTDQIAHLEQLVFRVVPDTVAENHGRRMIGVLHFPRLVGLQHGTGEVVLGQMKRSLQRRLGDQEIIDEELFV